jgi:hypothetical protein
LTLTPPAAPNWSKVGSQWFSSGEPADIELVLRAQKKESTVALYSPHAGVIRHEYFEGNDDRFRILMRNAADFAPEANFVSTEVHAPVSEPAVDGDAHLVENAGELYLKSCNRCARFLPINVDDERKALSFSNHCVAAHRRPCSHAGFGKLKNASTGESLELEYGFQLECRICKKFTVNAEHNPQRTDAQRKEDGARRRAFEELLTELYGGSPSLRYREMNAGSELVEDVLSNFGDRCFKCGTRLAGGTAMHLDHTRPLALLWPLDGSATALCPTHNSEKRDRPPSEFYDDDELERLSELTGLSEDELRNPGPNREAIEKLASRLDWFFDDFLQRDHLQLEAEGKKPADLLVKALQKAINRDPHGPLLDLEAELRKRSI